MDNNGAYIQTWKVLTAMQQFQTSYQNPAALRETLAAWQRWRGENGGGTALLHIFSDGAKEGDVRAARAAVEELMPDALYVGASASGNLYRGSVSTEKLVVTCTVLTDAESFADTRLFSIENRDAAPFREALREMRDFLKDVKAIEVIMTIDTIPIREVCAVIQEEIPAEIPVWGGGAFGDNTFTAFVFDRGADINTRGVVMSFYGGDNFHATNACVVGWKPLGAPLTVTSAEGKVLHSLNGEPAFETYRHYLKIPNDEHLFYNALEFPFAVTLDDHVLLRHALSCQEDGSLVMSTDIPEGSVLHVTYGDPETILQSVQNCAEKISAFSPEVISVFDCFGRKTFWGAREASREITPLHSLAPTYGFCTAGELIRWQGRMDHHNLSLVVAAMREGGPVEREMPDFSAEIAQDEASMPMVSRLANFINTATAELMEANETLSRMAVTDLLTWLYNRGEIQRQITERIHARAGDPTAENATSLVMIDLDDFKHINDTYGQQEGDAVLIGISAAIREAVETLGIGAAGRWGGEEFMIQLPGMGQAEAAAFAEELRAVIEGLKFPLCSGETASFGVAQALPGEGADPLILRADAALYEAKRTGKNRVCLAK